MFQVCLRTAEALLIGARNLAPVHSPVVAGFSLGSLAQVKTCSYPTPLARLKRRDYIAATVFVWTTKVVPEHQGDDFYPDTQIEKPMLCRRYGNSPTSGTR